MRYEVRIFFEVEGERVSCLCGHAHGGLVSAADCAAELCEAGYKVKFESVCEGVALDVSPATLAAVTELLQPRGIIAVDRV